MEEEFSYRKLSSPKSALELLDMYFLDMRSALIETAASMDRMERSHGGDDIFRDPRIQKLITACDIIKNSRTNRCEQILMLLSDTNP